LNANHKILKEAEALSTPRGKVTLLLKRIVISLGISLLFALFAIIPRLGYFGEADVTVIERHWTGFWRLDVKFNATVSPFLYPFSWLSGYGSPSGAFRTVSVPTYIGGGEFSYPAWRTPADLEDEVMTKVIISEVPINILFNFGVILAVELTKLRRLYFCILGGIVGFPIGGPIGAVVGFFVGTLLLIYVIPTIMKSPYGAKIRSFFLGEEAGSYDASRS